MNGKRKVTACIAAAVLLAAGVLGVAMTAAGKGQLSARETEQYYREKEKELTADIRGYLQTQGYRDSGVTVARVLNGDGSRDYTVTLHHRGLDGLSDEARDALIRELAALQFQEEGCSFRYKFL